MIDGHDFLTAHFTNNERTIVESLWIDPKTKEIREYTLEAVEGNEDWETLLKHIDIDTLHESTYKHIREQNQMFENQVIAIAKERGMVYDVDAINTDIYKAIGSAIFAPFDPEQDKEKLFMYKLQLFEVEAIKESKNKELKSKLRKAKDLLESTKIAVQIVENN
jgi:hypothetical protein